MPVIGGDRGGMGYRFATERADHRDLASGFVLRSAPGFPGFPVRLASEMFQRAAAHLPRRELMLWDALCGSGYLATVVGLLHRSALAGVIASDADEDAVGIATRNLALLTVSGLRERQAELGELAHEHGRSVHQHAAEAAERLIARLGDDLAHSAHVADVFRAPILPVRPDVVISDVPYGDLAHWRNAPAEPIAAAIRAIAAVVPPHAVIAVSARTRKIHLPGIPVLERFRVGLRAAVLVRAETGTV